MCKAIIFENLAYELCDMVYDVTQYHMTSFNKSFENIKKENHMFDRICSMIWSDIIWWNDIMWY